MSAHSERKRSRTFLDRREWGKRAKAGKVPDGAAIRKVYGAEFTKAAAENAEADPNRYTFTLSTASPDRYNDVVEVEGWETENYMRTGAPVVWAHDYEQLPIGRALAVRAENGALVAEMEFAPSDLNPFAAQVKGLLDAGFLRSCSVGFRPLEHSIDEERGGFNFKRQELLEFSIVPIPANPDATIQARAVGVDVTELERWVNGAQQLLGSESATVPRAALEAVTRHLGWEEEDWTKPLEELAAELEKPMDADELLKRSLSVALVSGDAPPLTFNGTFNGLGALEYQSAVRRAADAIRAADVPTEPLKEADLPEPVATVETIELASDHPEPTEEQISEILDVTDLDSLADDDEIEITDEEVSEEKVDALSPEVALEVDLDELGALIRQSIEEQWKPVLDAVSRATGRVA